MRIVILPEVRKWLSELVLILYEKNYFGFEDSADEYVEDLIADIKRTLPTRQKKEAPRFFNKYGKGMYYARFRKNYNTQWYVFFNIYKDEEGQTFLIRYISNNHVVAQYL